MISDEKLEKSEGVAFLESMRDPFVKESEGVKKLGELIPHFFPGEFNPVFRQLLGLVLYHLDGIESPIGQIIDETRRSFRYGSGPLRGRAMPNGEKVLNKTKNRLLEEVIGRRIVEKEINENRRNGMGLSPHVTQKNRGLYCGELSGHQEANKVWKKRVWIVLWLDLIVCAILFDVWLWVCSGLKCLES